MQCVRSRRWSSKFLKFNKCILSFQPTSNTQTLQTHIHFLGQKLFRAQNNFGNAKFQSENRFIWNNFGAKIVSYETILERKLFHLLRPLMKRFSFRNMFLWNSFKSMNNWHHDPGWVSNSSFETGKNLHGIKLGESRMGGRLLCPVVVVVAAGSLDWRIGTAPRLP